MNSFYHLSYIACINIRYTVIFADGVRLLAMVSALGDNRNNKLGDIPNETETTEEWPLPEDILWIIKMTSLRVFVELYLLWSVYGRLNNYKRVALGYNRNNKLGTVPLVNETEMRQKPLRQRNRPDDIPWITTMISLRVFVWLRLLLSALTANLLKVV